MDREEKEKKIETMKVLIKAECLRIMELLDTKQDLSYAFTSGPSAKSELKGKMHALRKDTMRMEHLMYGGYSVEE